MIIRRWFTAAVRSGFTAAFATAAAAAALPALAQAQQQAMTPEQQKAMEAWQKYMTPGEAHRHLAQTAGTWKATMRDFHTPDAPPQTGTSENRMILGGRFLQQEMRATFMGMPFEGVGLTGYDNMAGEFQSVWVDNFGTGMMYLTGKAEPGAKLQTMSGTMMSPETGKPIKVRTVVRYESKDRHVFEMYGPGPDGKEMRMMEITYERQ